MKETVLLNQRWELKQVEQAENIDPSVFNGKDDWLSVFTFPAQVHDVLYSHKKIPEEYLVGWCESITWIDDCDWVYRCIFKAEPGRKALLVFYGLDTAADIYLNGTLIGCHDDFYISQTIDVSSKLKPENTLLLHFHNVKGLLAKEDLDPNWKGQMLKCKIIRKPVHDFIPESPGPGSEYQGAYPWFTPIGIYRDVALVYPDDAEIKESNFCPLVNKDDTGQISFDVSGTGTAKELEIRLKAADEDGREYTETLPCTDVGGGEFRASCTMRIDKPKLWWPRGMGSQSLYRISVELYQRGGELLDRQDKQIGFKRVESPSPLEFIINGKRVRLFGGSMDPLYGYTHCYLPDKYQRLFALVENANMNTLRIWGEGIPQPDVFYEEADRRGILIWQEFFLGHGAFPDSGEYKAKLLAEARELILRLRHHVSLIIWCGGNESLMGAEHEGKRMSGNSILLEDFPGLLAELDPGRYYHPSSPSGGAWANDPREGDYHTYNRVIEYPYGDYPNFTSECIRTAPPVMHSLQRFIKGDLWPAGYDGKFGYEDTFPFPDNWAIRTNHQVRGEIKTGSYYEFYDADNAEQMIYRFVAGYGKDLRREIEHIRMGSPDGNVPQSKRSKGFLSCKLLDTWPKIYCAVIDFFQEAFIPYYTTLRGMEPLLLCFDRKDSIRLWLCNDSGGDFTGSVKLGLYNLDKEEYIVSETIPVLMSQGESGIIRDLADVKYFFPKETALCAQLFDEGGNLISDAVDYVAEERRLKFPDAVLNVEVRDRVLYVTSDRFARCVEILGKKDSDPFGWLFSDNYFDLLPGVTKKVLVRDGPLYGKITLKPHYSKRSVAIDYRRDH
jgi:hypothetical protein